DAMRVSGTHLLDESQSASMLNAVGARLMITLVGRQCAPEQEHAGRLVGSRTGAPWCGTHAPASPSPAPASPPLAASPPSAKASVDTLPSSMKPASCDASSRLLPPSVLA